MRRMAAFAKGKQLSVCLAILCSWPATAMYATYFPELYDEYARTLSSLYDDNPLLRSVFDGSPWPAVSINFPPNAYTELHTDAANKSNGMCPVFALGDYDYTKGGHLVLPDLNLVIEFPPGSIIFIPSATLRHGNIPVQSHEIRISWTQYAAGGLFRWVHYGRRSWAALQREDSERAALELAKRNSRWEELIGAFPTISSIRARASA
jgi:hypothetical protein